MASIPASSLSPKARARFADQLAAGTPQAKRVATKRAKVGDGQSDLERALLTQIKQVGLPAPVTQHVFAPPRKWRWDGCWPDRMLAYEIQGGLRNGGKHVRAEGYQIDCDKANAAVMLNWKCLRFTAPMIEDGSAVKLLEQALTGKGK
jgi:hypothetical protein